MVRIGFALALCALPVSAAQAVERPPLCEALHGLADAARSSGQAQRVTVSAGGGEALVCRADRNAAAGAFCDAAAGEPADALPWRLKRECLGTMAADPQVQTGAERVGGGKRMTRLTAKLGHGVRLDVSSVGPGRYDLVVWAPK